jgi:hypothetical protein
MIFANRRYYFVFAVLVMCWVVVFAASKAQPDGKLVVMVTWGDLDNTPATDVYIEAHGWVEKLRAYKTIHLKLVRAGQYEAVLPPGIYDVFISEASSVPRCKRVLIRPGGTESYTLRLEIDEVHIEKSSTATR